MTLLDKAASDALDTYNEQSIGMSWALSFDDESQHGQETARAQVRAVLQAIRTPTPGMIGAMMATPGMKEVQDVLTATFARQLASPGLRYEERGEEPPLVQAWQAGIDYILKGGE